MERVAAKTRTRGRLIARMTAVVADVGRAEVSVDLVLGGTGIARSTFYEHFRDLDACFEESVRAAGARLVERLDDPPSADPAGWGSVLGGFADFCREERASATVLFCESLAGGRRARRIRDRVAAQVECRLRGAGQEEPGSQARPELAAIIFRLLAVRLARGEAEDGDLAGALSAWTAIYLRRPSWIAQGTSVGVSVEPLAPGEPPWPAAEGEAGERLRPGGPALLPESRPGVLRAVVEIASEEGYGAATVAAISRRAGISRKAFYGQFAGREQAGVLAAEEVFGACMSICAGAFFSRASWPERTWEGGRALLGFIATRPRDAYYGFVEAPTIGRAAVEMVYDRLSAFTLFLEEGYRVAGEGAVPRGTSEILMAAMFELAYQELEARRPATELLGRLPEFAYLILAPFLGEEEAAAFVAAKAVEG